MKEETTFNDSDKIERIDLIKSNQNEGYMNQFFSVSLQTFFERYYYIYNWLFRKSITMQ